MNVRSAVAGVVLLVSIGCGQNSNSTPNSDPKHDAFMACVKDSLAWTEEKKRLVEAPATKEALGKLVARTDEVTGTTWYHADKQSQQLARTSTRSYFAAYFGKFRDGGNGPLRIQLQYGGDDWVFARELILNADGDVFQSMPAKAWKMDHSGGHVWETLDTTVSDFLPPGAFEKVLTAKRVIVRFRGRESSSDFVIPAGQRAAVAKLYELWKVTQPTRPQPECGT